MRRILISTLIAALLLLTASSGHGVATILAYSPAPVSSESHNPSCGDGICHASMGETCWNCQEDCGDPDLSNPPLCIVNGETCGDGVCIESEVDVCYADCANTDASMRAMMSLRSIETCPVTPGIEISGSEISIVGGLHSNSDLELQTNNGTTNQIDGWVSAVGTINYSPSVDFSSPPAGGVASLPDPLGALHRIEDWEPGGSLAEAADLDTCPVASNNTDGDCYHTTWPGSGQVLEGVYYLTSAVSVSAAGMGIGPRGATIILDGVNFRTTGEFEPVGGATEVQPYQLSEAGLDNYEASGASTAEIQFVSQMLQPNWLLIMTDYVSSNVCSTTSSAQGIQFSANTVWKGILYAPQAPCKMTFAEAQGNGALICQGLDITGSSFSLTWDVSSDPPPPDVPADFNGDGTSEVTIFRGGAWHLYNYADASLMTSIWTGMGSATAEPIMMDYDGDGSDDLSVYDSGAWHFFNDDGTYNKGIWTGNEAGDLPAPGDYDNDGDDDPVIFRGGAWLWFDFDSGAWDAGRSVWTGTGEGSAAWAAPMDYDGDGSEDFTVYNSGAWHFFNDDGTYNKGIWVAYLNGVPVPGDYNGDGTDDVVLFDSGAWHWFDFDTGAYDAALSVYTGTPTPKYNNGETLPAPLDIDGDHWMDRSMYAGGPWHFFGYDGSFVKNIPTGGVVGDMDVSARPVEPIPPAPPPTAPLIAFSSVTATSIGVMWTATADTYTLEWSPDNSAWTTLLNQQAVTSYSHTLLTCGTTYYYRVTAYRASDGQTATSGVASQATNACPQPPPTAPTDLTLDCRTGGGSGRYPELDWTQVAGVDGYQVWARNNTLGHTSYQLIRTFTGGAGATVTCGNGDPSNANSCFAANPSYYSAGNSYSYYVLSFRGSPPVYSTPSNTITGYCN